MVIGCWIRTAILHGQDGAGFGFEIESGVLDFGTGWGGQQWEQASTFGAAVAAEAETVRDGAFVA
jgi:hypothetical protein